MTSICHTFNITKYLIPPILSVLQKRLMQLHRLSQNWHTIKKNLRLFYFETKCVYLTISLLCTHVCLSFCSNRSCEFSHDLSSCLSLKSPHLRNNKTIRHILININVYSERRDQTAHLMATKKLQSLYLVT